MHWKLFKALFTWPKSPKPTVGQICPCCYSSNTFRDPVDLSPGTLHILRAPGGCNECSARWVDYYKHVSFECTYQPK